MPIDTTAKRLNLASRTMTCAQALLDAGNDGREIQEEMAQAENYADADFENTSMLHLDAFLIGVMRDQVLPGLQTWLDAPAYEGGASNRQLLQKVLP